MMSAVWILQRSRGKKRDLLDITCLEQIRALGSALNRRGSSFDVLFIVAGIADGPDDRVYSTSKERFAEVMTVNAWAPMRVIYALADYVQTDGVIAVMSSRLGSVSGRTSSEWEAYSASKAALNLLMKSYAARAAHSGLTMLVVAPGWVRTDMGGKDASLDVETSVHGIANVICAWSKPPGISFVDYNGHEVPW